jgi:transposase
VASASRLSRLLATVPGVGIMGPSAITATVADPSLFRSGPEFAAWMGMTPRQNSSGGKECLGRTSKHGDKYIRSLLIAGAVAVLRHAHNRPTRVASGFERCWRANRPNSPRSHWPTKPPHRLGGDDAPGWLPGDGGFRATDIGAASPFSMRG